MDHLFTTVPHHDILALLIQVGVLLFTARALGALAQRFGQPSVVGEILAGIVLGPSLISGVIPVAGEWFVPQNQTQVHLLDTFSMLGSLFLMFIAGMEIDLALIRRQARSAIGAGLGGLIVPFFAGLLMAFYLPDSILVNPEKRLVFSLFVAIAMSISAIPVIAKVLMDLNMIRRDSSQIIISAAMIEDAIAWTGLSIIVGLTETDTITTSNLLRSIGSVLFFLVLSFVFGRWFVKKALDFVQNEVQIPDAILSLVVVLMFGWASVSHALHLEPVIGAFTMGILFSQMRTLPDSVIEKMESIALSIFAPIFFAVAGLKFHLTSFFNLHLLSIALIVIVIASVGKILGTYIGARIAGKRDHWVALSYGIGLNARGAVEIIIASVGLSKGVLSQDMFSVIVLMAIVTSLSTPPALRWVLKYVTPEQQELDRLRHEELLKDNLFAHVHRVLLPVRRREDDRGGPAQTIEARILEHIGARKRISLTLLNIPADGDRTASTNFLDKLSRMFFTHLEVTKKVVTQADPVNVILDEAKKDYDLVVLGAPERDGGTEHLFNPIVDSLVRLSPCPSIVVHSNKVPHDWEPRRILAPTNGSLAARRAVQAAFSLAAGSGGEVLILKVVKYDVAMCNLEARETLLERQYIISHQIVDELGAMGLSLGVQTFTAVHPGPDPESVILEVAENTNIDLIILGTNVRAGSDRLYLGSRVERILKRAKCPVIVVNS